MAIGATVLIGVIARATSRIRSPAPFVTTMAVAAMVMDEAMDEVMDEVMDEAMGMGAVMVIAATGIGIGIAIGIDTPVAGIAGAIRCEITGVAITSAAAVGTRGSIIAGGPITLCIGPIVTSTTLATVTAAVTSLGRTGGGVRRGMA